LRDYDKIQKKTLSSLNSKRAAGSQLEEESTSSGVLETPQSLAPLRTLRELN
ncbi:Hypothetical protein FKW44_025354, partial [Caligus rogercresseyi]